MSIRSLFIGTLIVSVVAFQTTLARASQLEGPDAQDHTKVAAGDRVSGAYSESLKLNTDNRDKYFINRGYQKLFHAGIVLTAIGGASTLSGAIILAMAGSHDCGGDDYDDENPDSGMASLGCALGAGAEAAIGGIIMSTSLAIVIPGIVMTIVGYRNKHRPLRKDIAEINRELRAPQWRGLSVWASPSENQIKGLTATFSF